MATAKPTVRLPKDASGGAIHPAVEKISGLVPANIDAREVYLRHLVSKHR